MSQLSRVVNEWRPLPLADPMCWSYPAVAAAALGGAVASGRKSWPLAAAAGVFGVLALRHARFFLYFALAGVPCAALGLAALESRGPRWRALAAGGLVATAAALVSLALLAPDLRPPRLVQAPPIAGAAEFLALTRATYGGRPVLAAFEWGGYLGWRLWPDNPVVLDGRYIFADLIVEMDASARDPRAWKAFLDRSGAQLAVLERDGPPLPFPRADWERVYADAYAVVLARRGSATAKRP
jgi:hypothetical protein